MHNTARRGRTSPQMQTLSPQHDSCICPTFSQPAISCSNKPYPYHSHIMKRPCRAALLCAIEYNVAVCMAKCSPELKCMGNRRNSYRIALKRKNFNAIAILKKVVITQVWHIVTPGLLSTFLLLT